MKNVNKFGLRRSGVGNSFAFKGHIRDKLGNPVQYTSM